MRSRVFVLLSMGGGLCGVAALLLYFYLIPVKIMVSSGEVEYIYSKLSLHMWFLEMILLVFGISIAVLGFIGYQSIRDEAVKKATDQAVKKATDQAVKKAAEEARRELKRWEDELRGPYEFGEQRPDGHQVQSVPEEDTL